jgi:hypothetical protein
VLELGTFAVVFPKLPRYYFLDNLSSLFEIRVFGTKLQLLSHQQLLAACLNTCSTSPAASHVHSRINLELHQFCVWKKPEENSLKKKHLQRISST